MKILIADDDPTARLLLETTLQGWHHEVLTATDGAEAWKILTEPAKPLPSIAIMDWIMPKKDGIDICRELRTMPTMKSLYIILLTAKSKTEDVITGLQAGADDYIVKPFHREELRARLNAGVRIVGLQADLSKRVRELEAALANVKRLQGLLPICSYCKKIRADQNYWQHVEGYISEHISDVRFSHGVCPDCYRKEVEPQIEELRSKPAHEAALAAKIAKVS